MHAYIAYMHACITHTYIHTYINTWVARHIFRRIACCLDPVEGTRFMRTACLAGVIRGIEPSRGAILASCRSGAASGRHGGDEFLARNARGDCAGGCHETTRNKVGIVTEMIGLVTPQAGWAEAARTILPSQMCVYVMHTQHTHTHTHARTHTHTHTYTHTHLRGEATPG